MADSSSKTLQTNANIMQNGRFQLPSVANSMPNSMQWKVLALKCCAQHAKWTVCKMLQIPCKMVPVPALKCWQIGTTRNPAQISRHGNFLPVENIAMLYRYHGGEHIGNICLNQEYLSGFAEAVVFSLINQWRICWEHVLLLFLGNPKEPLQEGGQSLHLR